MQIDRYWAHLAQNWKLAYPIVITQVGHMALGVTDSIMVGHVGAVALAASALANTLFNIFVIFGIGVSLAISPLVAASSAQGDRSDTVAWLRHGLVISILLGLVLMGIVIAGHGLLWKLDQPPEVVEQAIPYLLILSFSLLPILLFQAFRQFADGLSVTKVSMVTMLLGILLNIVLNYVLIYGQPMLGIPAFGLVGAGLGTLFARILMVAAMAVYIYKAPRFTVYTAQALYTPYLWVRFKKMLKIGVPIGVQLVAEVFAFEFSAIMMGWLGAYALAAHQIAISLSLMSYMMVVGLAMATTVRVGTEWGRGRFVEMKESCMVFFSMMLVFVFLWGGAFIVAGDLFPYWFVNDPQVVALAQQLVFIVGLFQFSDGIQAISAGALRGLQDVRVPSVTVFSAYWLVGLPLGYWLAFRAGYGPLGVWVGLLVGLTLVSIVLFVRLQRMFARFPVSVDSVDE